MSIILLRIIFFLLNKLFLLIVGFFMTFTLAQNSENVSNRFEKMQGQDFTTPPPPITAFPAQFPGGLKKLLIEITKNIDKNTTKSLSKRLKTKIIIKIDREGNVIYVGTYGSNKVFDDEVKRATVIVIDNIIWESGKNKRGENVVDLQMIPFNFSN